jgi:hypothetical protein
MSQMCGKNFQLFLFLVVIEGRGRNGRHVDILNCSQGVLGLDHKSLEHAPFSAHQGSRNVLGLYLH